MFVKAMGWNSSEQPGDALEKAPAALTPAGPEGCGVELRLELPPHNLMLNTDRRALHQILLNLASNAIKFTGTGSVSLKLRQSGENGSALAEFSVTDTGLGISVDDQRRLFSAFEQIRSPGRRSEGTGLGLYVSQKLANLLGGQITLQSEVGQGSRFTLQLPGS